MMRTPAIVADAAHAILRRRRAERRPAASCSTRTCCAKPASATSALRGEARHRRCCRTSSSTDPRAAARRLARQRLPKSSSTIFGGLIAGATLPAFSPAGPPPALRGCRNRRRRPSAPWPPAPRCRDSRRPACRDAARSADLAVAEIVVDDPRRPRHRRVVAGVVAGRAAAPLAVAARALLAAAPVPVGTARTAEPAGPVRVSPVRSAAPPGLRCGLPLRCPSPWPPGPRGPPDPGPFGRGPVVPGSPSGTPPGMVSVVITYGEPPDRRQPHPAGLPCGRPWPPPPPYGLPPPKGLPPRRAAALPPRRAPPCPGGRPPPPGWPPPPCPIRRRDRVAEIVLVDARGQRHVGPAATGHRAAAVIVPPLAVTRRCRSPRRRCRARAAVRRRRRPCRARGPASACCRPASCRWTRAFRSPSASGPRRSAPR